MTKKSKRLLIQESWIQKARDSQGTGKGINEV